MKEGQKEAKMLEPGKWKWARSPGDGVKYSCFQCNAHVDCGLHIRVVLLDGSYHLQQQGKHSEKVKEKARVNSALTYADDEKLKLCVNAGAKPAAVLASLAGATWDELVKQGKDPLKHKKKEGGMTGALAISSTCISNVLPMY